jgi:hypothetical protein
VKSKTEFDTFEHNLKELLKVPHAAIKSKLDEEKAKKQKTKDSKVKRHDD